MEQVEAVAQEFSNDEVRFKVHRKPACVVEYEVDALPQLVREAQKKAVRSVSKEVSLPGFRKGKAPEEMVLRNYAKEVDKEWQQEIANGAFKACQKMSNTPLLQRDVKISFQLKSHSLQEGAKLTLSFETEPSIPIVDPKQCTLQEVKRPEVNEEKVKETIRQVRFFFAEWKPIYDRPAQEGDYLLLDVEDIEEDPPVRIFNNTRFEVSEKGMARWMRELAIGMRVSETKEGISIPDEEATEEQKETLKPKKVRLTLKTIEEATLPELTEEFAQKLGVPSLAELHTSIEALLNKKADEHVRTQLREQINTFLLNHYPFDMPVTLIQRETQFRIQELYRDPQFQRYWGQMKESERKATVQSLFQQSEKAVRMFYLCRKILADAHISVSPKDLPAPQTNLLEMLLSPDGNHHSSHPEEEVRLAEAYSRLILEKAEDFLIENAHKI